MLNYPSFFNGVSAPYQIEQSLRFAGETNQYLYRTGAITAQGGVSLWVKFHRDVGYYTAGIYDPIIYLSGGGPWLYRNPYGRLYYRSINTGGDTTWGDQTCRDHSAWYHIFLKFNSSSSTSLYVNNVLWGTQSSSIGTSSGDQRVGYDGSALGQFYLAEYHAAFGESLDATDFGEYDDNGVWVPKGFTGNYGSQGFYLKFDPSAANGLGHDHSGNGNHFTDAGGFTTSGTGTDVMSDTPTTNYATLNPIFKVTTTTGGGNIGGGTYANGNLEHSEGSINFRHTISTLALPSSGKVYVEVEADTLASSYGSVFGLMLESKLNYPDDGDNFYVYCQANGTLTIEGTNPSTVSAGDIFSLSVDMSASPIEIVVRKNNTVVGSNPYTLSTTETLFFWSRNAFGSKLIWNFGQRDFAYTPPTGYKALNTSNLPAPDIADGSDYFNTVLYTGDGGTQSITGVGFQPDFTWIKIRSQVTDHVLQDAVRGAFRFLNSNSTLGENTNSQIDFFSSFDSDGFTVKYQASNGANYWQTNKSGDTYVAWNWLASNTSGSSNTDGSITSTVSANPSAGFSIVTYTGTGSAATVGHGLGVAPAMIITKYRNATGYDWYVYHKNVTSGKYLRLNTTEGEIGPELTLYSSAPSSTVINYGSSVGVVANGGTYVAYCFAEVEGYSKFGSYTGNGSTDGPFVFCNFRPAWVLTKRTDSTSAWYLHDTVRNTYNVVNLALSPDLSDAEVSANNNLDILSNGFKLRTSGAWMNASGGTYIFMALAENPFGGDGVSPATAR
jgi:hypothetical protein